MTITDIYCERYTSEAFRWKGDSSSRIKADRIISAAKEGLTSIQLAQELMVEASYLRTCARSIGIRLADMPKERGRKARNLLVPYVPQEPIPVPGLPPPSQAMLALALFDRATARALKRRLGQTVEEQDRDPRLY